MVANGSLSVSDDQLVGKQTWGKMKGRAMRWHEFETGIEFKNLSVFQQSDAKRFRELEIASNSIGCIKEKGIANKHAYPVIDLVEFEKSG